MAILKQSTIYTRMFLMVASSDHITGLTGAAPAVTISKAGGAFTTATNSPATEVANGWYKIALAATDVGTLGELAIHCTAASGDPTDFVDQVQSQVFPDLQLAASGRALAGSNIQQNAALNGFTFVMTDNVNHQAATGLTVTAQRSLGGAGFSPCANAVTELSNGVYSINLASTDTNGDTIMLRFTATGADDLDISLITQP